MSKYNKIFLFIFLSLLWQTATMAIEVNDLYQAKIEVDSKNKKDKQTALKQAMEAVIFKVAGEKSALKNPLVKQALQKNANYFTQYSYQKESGKNMMLVAFDEAKINRLLTEANLPIWGRLRPNVLLWVVNEEGLIREVVDEKSQLFIPEQVQAFSSLRGLPFMLPAWDEQDQNNIFISDVWGRFVSPVVEASDRYHAESIVVIRLSESSLVNHNEDNYSDEANILVDNQKTPQLAFCVDNSLCNKSPEKIYALDWRFIADGKPINVGEFYQGAEPSQLLNQALEEITTYLYQKYALSSGENNEIIIEVANVNSLADYIHIMDFLHALSSVKSVTLKQAKGTTRQFYLSLIGSPEAFLSNLKLDQALYQDIDPLADMNAEHIPVFYWKNP